MESRIAPTIIRGTIGVVAVSTRRYIDWMQALHRHVFHFISRTLCLTSKPHIYQIYRNFCMDASHVGVLHAPA